MFPSSLSNTAAGLTLQRTVLNIFNPCPPKNYTHLTALIYPSKMPNPLGKDCIIFP